MEWTDWVDARLKALKKPASGLGHALGADISNRNAGKDVRKGKRIWRVADVAPLAEYLEVTPIEMLRQFGLDLKPYVEPALEVDDIVAATTAIAAEFRRRDREPDPELWGRYTNAVLREWLERRAEGSTEPMENLVARVFRISANIAA